jgi:hypothetical protein
VFVPAFGDRDAEVRLKLEPRALVLPLLCPSGSYRRGTGVLLAKVTTPENTGVPHAHVTVFLDATATATAAKLNGTADDNGRFSICGADVGRPLRIRASGDRRDGEIAITTWTDEVMPVQVVIIPRAKTPP